MTAKTTVGTYYTADFDSLTVVNHGPDNPIVPASSKHTARSTAGTFVLSFPDGETLFGPNVGGLYGFDFACGDPCTPTTSKAAASCDLTITASCVFLNLTTYIEGGAYEYTETYSYTAPTKHVANAAMTSALWNAAEGYENDGNPSDHYEDYWCYNYTFVATMADGKTPFLYVDNVVGNYYYNVE